MVFLDSLCFYALLWLFGPNALFGPDALFGMSVLMMYL